MRKAPAIFASGIGADRMGRLAALFDVGTAVCDVAMTGTFSEHALLLTASPENGVLDDLFRRGMGRCIEVDGYSDPEVREAACRADRSDLFLSLTTATTYRGSVSRWVMQGIGLRQVLTPERRDDIELALQEAISNAVLHGNLQMDSLDGVSVAALERFHAETALRLELPAFADRRVEVAVTLGRAVTIEVVDQGVGYIWSPRGGGVASGRGIALIATISDDFEVLQNGRCMRMSFAL
ncbi:MAG: ATP-binding protein [Azospirillaceae bacterium]|nr:ATP-binding protein [Azospirillaceae bacterium]